MQTRKSIMVAIASGAVGLTLLAGVAKADTTGVSLVDKLAQKFSLKKEDVQKVFDEYRVEKQANREQKYEERLAQAVKDGKLTEDQKSKLVPKHKELVAKLEAKHKSMKDQREAFKDKTEAERKALMEQRRAEMDKQRAEVEAWEKANNIPTGYLGLGGPGHGHGLGHRDFGPR